MKNRIIHTIYLAPAILLLLMWIAVSPVLIAQLSSLKLLAAVIVTAIMMAWCITLFAHAVRQGKP